MLCFFRKLSSHVKFKLFCSYCTSFYGCELWSLNSNYIEDLCVAWRKSIRLIWNLPPLTHCYLLPLICRCLPIFDEICRRSLNFVRACVKHESSLVRSLAVYGLTVARYKSPIGSNVLFCAHRYLCTVDDLLQGSVNNIITSHVRANTIDSHLTSANFLLELLNIRDSCDLSLANLSSDELQEIIGFVCTS